jgi:hypothetical protein
LTSPSGDGVERAECARSHRLAAGGFGVVNDDQFRAVRGAAHPAPALPHLTQGVGVTDLGKIVYA